MQLYTGRHQSLMTWHLNTTYLGDRMLAKNILLLEPSGIRTTRQSPLTISTTCTFNTLFNWLTFLASV